MITQGMIDQFYRDVEMLGLKYPVAEITKKTGLSKGQVSQVLSRKLSPSEQLITKFYKGFNIVPNDKNSKKGNPSPSHYLDNSDVKITLQDYINLLHRENERLFTILNSALGRISEDSHTGLAYQKAWVKYEAERASGGDKQKEAEIRYKMSKLVDDELRIDDESGNPDEIDK